MKAFNSLILAALLAATPSPALARKKDDAVLLSKVKSLTLRDGQRTSHRRVDALPQLNCVGGDGCQFYKVDTMRCTNSGSEYDAEDIQWTCKASLPPEFKLGSTDVICEGYDNADDPYILKGSCGVEYRLMLTDSGEEKYRDHISRGAWRSWNGKQGNHGDWLASVLFWLVFACECTLNSLQEHILTNSQPSSVSYSTTSSFQIKTISNVAETALEVAMEAVEAAVTTMMTRRLHTPHEQILDPGSRITVASFLD